MLYYCDASIDTLRRSTGVAVVVRDGQGRILDAASCYLEGMTNNEAEYEALILGLELALARSDPAVTLLTDSQVVVGQVSGRFAVRDRKLAPRHERACRLLAQLREATLAHISRERNRLADALAGEAMEVGLGRGRVEPRPGREELRPYGGRW
jgi:ribonuclease HI